MQNNKKLGFILSVILFSSCSNEGGQNNNHDQVENKFYPLASQKSILLTQDPQSTSIDTKVDDTARILRDKNCKLQGAGEISDINSIIGVNGNLLAAPNPNTGYSYQYEIILSQTKDLIDKYACYYPEIYLANANILLKISEIPTDLLNSENRLIQSAGLNSEEENNLTNQVQTSDDLKFSKFAKLNSVIREAQTALSLLQADSNDGASFTHITASNASGKPVALFDSEFAQSGSAESDKFAEASIYANYLLAKSHYERALYRLQGIVSSDDLYESVDVPNDLYFLGAQSSVREIIAQDLKQSRIAATSIYSSSFCSTNSLNAHLPAHMSTMCGDLKNIFGDDLSVLITPLDSVIFNNNFSLKLGRLVCSADTRYTTHADEVKFCQNFLTKFPSAKNANLNENGLGYSSVNSWSLNLAGVVQHLGYLDSSLTTVVNNIVQNKNTILNTQDVNNKLVELTAQKQSLTDEFSIAKNNIITAQDNVSANQAALGSAQAAVSSLQNQYLMEKTQQGNLFRNYLTTIRKEQYTTLLLNALADKQTAVQNFKTTFASLSQNTTDTLNNVLSAVKQEWVAQCSQSLLDYNHNVDLLNTYKCMIAIKPEDYWKDKSKWNDVTSQEYSDQWKAIAQKITDSAAGECQSVAIAAAYARESELAIKNADSDQIPYVKDGNSNTIPAWYSYAQSLSSLASQQQVAKDIQAQILAIQTQYAFKYGFMDTSTKFKDSTADLQAQCNTFIESDSSGYLTVKAEILQNDISTAAQTMSNQITTDNLVQEQNSLQSSLDDFKSQIQEIAANLVLDKNTRNTYESNPSVVFNFTQAQLDAEVTKYTNSLSDSSPAIKVILDQISSASYEVVRAQSLLDAANSDLNSHNLYLVEVQNNIAQLNSQIQNWDTTKNSFVFSSLVPSITSYADKKYLLSDAQESAQSLLKILAYRTMSFDSGEVSGPNYSQFLKLFDSAQLQCRYFASFGDAEKCILSLRSILDPTVAKVNFGLYGSHTEILPISIYSDAYYANGGGIDKRTPAQAQLNNLIIQNLRNSGTGILPINTATLAMEFDQGASAAQILNEFGMQRVIGVSVNIIKKDEYKTGDLTYSQDQNKIAVLRDGLNDVSSSENDCTQTLSYASAQAQNSKKLLATNNFDIRLQNLMSQDIMTNIICQKVNWVEKPQTASIPDISLLNQANNADTDWILNLQNKISHDYRPFFLNSDGAWNRISGLVNPTPQTNIATNYSNIMLGCLNDAIQNPLSSNLSLVRCNSTPVTSTIDFTNIAGNSLMGNWHFVYGEYGADAYDYNAETQSGTIPEAKKTKIVGLDVVFYLIKN